MNKWRYIFACIVVLFLLGGCSGKTVTNTQPHNNILQDDATAETFRIECWNLFEGSVPTNSQNDLGLIDEIKIENNLLDIYGETYIVFELPIDKLEMPLVSGWRINLNELFASNITPSGKVIFVSDSQKSPLICIHDGNSGENQLMFREDVAEMGVGAFELDDFQLYIDGSLVHKTEQIEAIWEMHTDGVYQIAYPVLDGDWNYYSLMLVHSTYPAIQYEINFGVCDNYLYIENLNVQGGVRVPVDQIMRGQGDGSSP